MTATIDTRNTNALWCSVWVETWVQCGLRQAIVSPGSRSTPLTMALAAHPSVEAIPVLDERSAGFWALGLARRSRRPVVLLCTSGSAAAHYLPALIEAHESGVPLIVVSADRPPELRDCASGQTIDQHKLFGDYVGWYHEMAVPELRAELWRYLRQTARQAWNRASNGPVHLNAPFRDPLPPLPDDGAAAAFAAEIDFATFWARPDEVEQSGGSTRLHQRITTVRGLIVAGPAQPADPRAYADHVHAIARATGWPILADALSPLRQHAAADVVTVSSYDTLLRSEALARELAPRFVLALESWPTSKVLRQWLEVSQAEMLMVSPRSGSRDAIHGKTRAITAPIESLSIVGEGANGGDYAASWARAEAAMRSQIDGWMESEASPEFEGQVAWSLANLMPDNAIVCVANSMPVRDLEYFWPTSNRGMEVFFSRGANGIDGTLSTALGVAHRAARPAFLLTGELAFLHDSNALLTVPEFVGQLTVIVVNNGGGGIFGHLPVAQFEDSFERYFATPQNVDFGRLCAAHGVRHEVAESMAAMRSRLAAINFEGLRVIEIRTDRVADAATRKRLFRDWARSVRIDS